MRYNRWFKDNNFLTPTEYTQQLSEYVEGLRYEDLPAEVADKAKKILLNTVGVILSAKNSEIYGKTLNMAKEANGGEGGTTTDWNSGTKLAAVNAALVLGTCADVRSEEDCMQTGHPSAAVIPCAWLAAEERHKSGKELIAAIAAAYEVYYRIAMSVKPSEEQIAARGWGEMSWQIFAAIIPIAKLYDLDARRINQAMGIGCECSTVPTSYAAVTHSDFKHYEYGYRARDGFLITKSAEKGIRNQRDLFDDPRAYAEGMVGHAADTDWLTKELGKHYYIMDAELRTKSGEPAADMSFEQLAELFAAQTAETVNADKAKEIIAGVSTIEAVNDISKLTELLFAD